MKKQIRNLVIAFAALGLFLVILATCAPAAAPIVPPSSTGAPLETPGAVFQVTKLRMTNGGDCDTALAITTFGLNTPIFINWEERGDRQGRSLNLKIKNTTNGTVYPTIPYEPRSTDTNRCESYRLAFTPAPGRGSYETSVDLEYRVTPVPWRIQ